MALWRLGTLFIRVCVCVCANYMVSTTALPVHQELFGNPKGSAELARYL